MDATSALVTTSMGGEAYAQWVRRAISGALSGCGKMVPLFDSSVEEPVELLRGIIEEGFRAPITDRYQSVFVNGNSYVLDCLAARYGVSTDSILATTGATSGLSLIYRTFLSPGDQILVERPGFDLFGIIASALGAKVDYFQRNGDGFEFDPDEIGRRITPKTRLIVLSDLHNPSGMLSDRSALRHLADIAERAGIRVVVDEVYGDYADGRDRPGSAVHLSPAIVSVNSMTKIYGLSSLRCGWILAHPDVLNPIRHVNDQFEFGVSKLAHAVAALVLEKRKLFDGYWRDILDTARPIVQSYYDRWRERDLVSGNLPRYGCVSFPRLTGIEDTLEFSAWLADRHGVIVAPGEFFGSRGHVRIGHAHSPDALESGLDRFSRGLEEYRETVAPAMASHA